MEDYISRNLRREEVAARMVLHQARPQTICAFTGLTHERTKSIRKAMKVGSKRRHRGPSPSSLRAFFRSARTHNEASCIALYCRFRQAVPAERMENAARFFPSLTRAERLCDVHEAYRTIFPRSELELEQTILIAIGLAQGDLIELRTCATCPRTILIDRLAPGEHLCSRCGSERAAQDRKKLPARRGRPRAGRRQKTPA
jgi:hypothetical protein